MLLAQRRVEYGKRAQSDLIGTALIILVIIGAVALLWTTIIRFVSQSPIEESCASITSFSVEDVCYLSNEEIKVTVKRTSDTLALTSLQFNFMPSDSLWEITGKKCSDVRLENKNYGGYCELVEPGETFSYVFNAKDLEKQQKVGVYVKTKILCGVGEHPIRNGC